MCDLAPSLTSILIVMFRYAEAQHGNSYANGGLALPYLHIPSFLPMEGLLAIIQTYR